MTPGAPRRLLRRALRAGEAGLAGAGVACLVVYAAACAQTSWWQAHESEAFDQAVRERLERLRADAPDQSDWSPGRIAKYEASRAAPVRALARLEIPAAELSVMVLDGTDETTLDRAVGRIEGTARPGEPGNLGIAGHRDGYFRGLKDLAPGDAIRLATLEGVAHYRVAGIDVVAPERVDVLDPTPEPTLTLVTCYPFYFVGDAPERYVVRAVRVDYEPWESAPSGPAASGPRIARP